jgi:GTP-binding protein HflX
VPISAKNGEGLTVLQDAVADFFTRSLTPVRLLVPYTEAGLLSRLRGIGSDMAEENTADGVLLRARLPEAEARRYAAFAAHGGASEDVVQDDAQSEDETDHGH